MTQLPDDTQRTSPFKPAQATATPPTEPKMPTVTITPDDDEAEQEGGVGCFLWGAIIGFTVLIALAIVILAGTAGWTEGQRIAANNATATQSAEINTQVQLVINEFAQGNLEMANIRLQFLATKAPGMAQVGELAATGTALFLTSQPTTTPTPTVTPTPEPATSTPQAVTLPTVDPLADQRQALGQRLDRARNFVALAQWPEAINELDIIINTDEQYEVATVRNLMSRALNAYARLLYQRGDLAEAIFHTDWAEDYGPLADGLNFERYIANLYLTATAAIGSTDVQTALTNLQEIYRLSPNYRDGEVRRLLGAQYAAFADALLVSQPCSAVAQYNNALNLNNDPAVVARRNTAQNWCDFGTPTPEGFIATPEGEFPPNGAPEQ